MLLQVNESARHLDEALVKFRLGLAADRKPDFRQHVVGLVVELRVEAAEKADVMAVEPR